MKRTRVKVCGITCIEDALAAVDQGVDGLGFIFFEKSPRNVDPVVARKIIEKLPPFVDIVGVFVNRSKEEIEELVNYCRLNHLQLHGDESTEFCEQVKSDLSTCRVMKAFRIGDSIDQILFDEYSPYVHGFLLDTYQKGVEGGTGHVFSWDMLKEVQLPKPLILAGGLNPENVVDAVAQVHPHALDINSGVELAPGKKDHKAIELLMSRLRKYEAESGFSKQK